MTYRRFSVYGLDEEFLITERNISDFTPGKSNLWGQPRRGTKQSDQTYVTTETHRIRVEKRELGQWPLKGNTH